MAASANLVVLQNMAAFLTFREQHYHIPITDEGWRRGICATISLMSIRDADALEYHSSKPAGKIGIVSTKPCQTQRDLSLAYTPGVAVPCMEIFRDPNAVYKA